MPGGLLPKIIAHRGASDRAPENTLAAFQLAWECGADGIEGDFRLTRDGRIVCLHDATTARTGDKALRASECTLEELRAVDLGIWKGDQFRGEHIATLEEVLEILPAGKLFFLEVKCGPEIVAPLKKILSKSPRLGRQLSVIAFDPRVISEMRTELPDLQANLLTELDFDLKSRSWQPTGAEVAALLEKLKTNGVGLQARLAAIDRDFLAPLREQKVALHVWTVDDRDSALQFAALGFESITSNRPDDIRKWLTAKQD